MAPIEIHDERVARVSYCLEAQCDGRTKCQNRYFGGLEGEGDNTVESAGQVFTSVGCRQQAS